MVDNPSDPPVGEQEQEQEQEQEGASDTLASKIGENQPTPRIEIPDDAPTIPGRVSPSAAGPEEDVDVDIEVDVLDEGGEELSEVREAADVEAPEEAPEAEEAQPDDGRGEAGAATPPRPPPSRRPMASSVPRPISKPPGAGPKTPTALPKPTGAASKPPTAASKPPEAASKPPAAASKPPEAASKPPTAASKPPTAASKPPTAASKPPEAAKQPPGALSRPPGARPSAPPPSRSPYASRPPRRSAPPPPPRSRRSEGTSDSMPAKRERSSGAPALSEPPRPRSEPPRPKSERATRLSEPPAKSRSSQPPVRSSRPPPGFLDSKEDKPLSQPPVTDLDEGDWSPAGEPEAPRAPGKLPAGFEEDPAFDGAKTQKLVRKDVPLASEMRSRTPTITNEASADGSFIDEDSSMSDSDDEGRASQPPRRRKGKRSTLKIPDDSIPSTPTPWAVSRSVEEEGEGEGALDEKTVVMPAEDEPTAAAGATQPSPAEEATRSVVHDETAISVLRPMDIMSDLPAVEALTRDEASDEEAASSRRPPPPRRGEWVEEIEEIEPERMSMPLAGEAPAAPPLPPPGPEQSGRHPVVPADQSGPQPVTQEGAADSALSSAEANLALAEARALEAAAKARAAEAKAREATAKASASREKKPWWVEMFEDDLIRTLDNPRRKDVERETLFIEKSLRLEPKSRILDLACGNGVHAVELAARGYQMVGVDHSKTMLALAEQYNQQRGTSVSFIKGDMRKLALEGVFDGIYCWGSSYGYFDEQVNAHVLERIAHALRPGGMFVLDVDNRDFVAPRSPTMAWFEKPGVVCMDEMRFDFYSSRMYTKRMVLFDNGRSREIESNIRLYTLHELGRLFHTAGFKVVEVSGHRGHRGAYFGAESPRTIITAKRREE